MVNPLVRLQLAHQFNRHCRIRPLQIPVFQILFHYDVVVEVEADLFDYFVLSVDEIGGDGFVFSFVVVFGGDGGKFAVAFFLVIFVGVVMPH